MSAAVEYYGYLLSQGYDDYQLKQFSNYAKKANRGEISHNKAYRLACKAGFDKLEGDSDKDTSFADWMKMSREAGWIDTGSIETKPVKVTDSVAKKDNSKLSKGLLIIGIGIAVYLITRKK